MNCSGKHAAMLATCVANGWPVGDYLDPDSPLQTAITAAVEELAGERVQHVAVDGCGAPQHALTLAGLARAFARLTTAAPGTNERRVADAMRAAPELVGGTGRDVTAFMQAVPGLLAKDGAEGVYGVALPDGAALALKIDDGAARARPPVLVEGLRALGVTSDALDALATVPVLGGGRPVGEVRATDALREAARAARDRVRA
jgi:L-asparaginase II